MRRYRTDEDYWRIREFLRDTFRRNDGREWSWQAYRFDYWRWHGVENLGHDRLENDVFIWEAADGAIVAVLNPERRGDACLQVHPGLRSRTLEQEMIEVAETHLPRPGRTGRPTVCVWSPEHDELRTRILRERGFVKGTLAEHQRRRSLSVPIPETRIANGYAVRALGDADELPARSLLSWKAFHPDEPDDRYEGWEWYQNIQRAPLYRRDLDLVAVAPGGELASFCTAWFDDVNRTGAFEPVGTAPAHQRRGLAKSLLHEGLRRLKQVGASVAYVASYTSGAHALYASAGFTEYDISEPWTKEL
jgi:GNAT superfamily N-acetyltransferase